MSHHGHVHLIHYTIVANLSPHHRPCSLILDTPKLNSSFSSLPRSIPKLAFLSLTGTHCSLAFPLATFFFSLIPPLKPPRPLHPSVTSFPSLLPQLSSFNLPPPFNSRNRRKSFWISAPFQVHLSRFPNALVSHLPLLVLFAITRSGTI